MIRRIIVHGTCTVGVLWCLSMITFLPAWQARLVNAAFLIAFVACAVAFWPHEKEEV